TRGRLSALGLGRARAGRVGGGRGRLRAAAAAHRSVPPPRARGRLKEPDESCAVLSRGRARHSRRSDARRPPCRMKAKVKRQRAEREAERRRSLQHRSTTKPQRRAMTRAALLSALTFVFCLLPSAFAVSSNAQAQSASKAA